MHRLIELVVCTLPSYLQLSGYLKIPCMHDAQLPHSWCNYRLRQLGELVYAHMVIKWRDGLAMHNLRLPGKSNGELVYAYLRLPGYRTG